MVNRVKFFVVFGIMIFAGLKVNAKNAKSTDYTQYVTEIISSFVNEMHKEYGFECGSSGGRMPHDVEEISVSLISYQSATVEQARELIIKTTERFAQIINAHEKIRPFLREYPFPSSRADVSISFRNFEKEKNPSLDEDVVYVFQARNKIFYKANNPHNPYVRRDIKDESYEVALKIVKADSGKMILQKS